MAEKRFVGRYAGRTIKRLIGIEDIETNRVCVTVEENIRLLNELNDENEQLKQISQDYEDIVNNWFIDNWNKLSDEMKQSAHLELGIDIEYTGDVE